MDLSPNPDLGPRVALMIGFWLASCTIAAAYCILTMS